MGILKKTAEYFARKSYCRKAIEEHADLGVFKEGIKLPIVTGMILIAISYAIGLPTVLAFVAFAASMNEPLIGIIGGALIYGISTLIFFVGIKMAGTKYFVALNRWLIRTTLEKILGSEAKARCALPQGSGSEEKKH